MLGKIYLKVEAVFLAILKEKSNIWMNYENAKNTTNKSVHKHMSILKRSKLLFTWDLVRQ